MTSKHIRKNRGITLIELVVAMALTVMILAAATAFISPLYTFYGESIKKAKAVKVSGKIEERLKEIIPAAIEMQVTTSATITHSGTDYCYLYTATNTSTGLKEIYFRFNNGSGTDARVFLPSAEYQGFNVDLDILTRYRNGESSKYTILIFKLYVKYGTTTITTRSISIYLYNMEGDASKKIFVLSTATNPNETTTYKSIKFKASFVIY